MPEWAGGVMLGRHRAARSERGARRRPGEARLGGSRLPEPDVEAQERSPAPGVASDGAESSKSDSAEPAVSRDVIRQGLGHAAAGSGSAARERRCTGVRISLSPSATACGSADWAADVVEYATYRLDGAAATMESRPAAIDSRPVAAGSPTGGEGRAKPVAELAVGDSIDGFGRAIGRLPCAHRCQCVAFGRRPVPRMGRVAYGACWT
jgi:hypothetical protein